MSDDVVGLDPDWILANVRVDEATPVGADFGGFIGTGQMSRNARWRLHWGDADGPASVVVKIPSADATVRAVSFEHGIYQKECEFYRSVRALTAVAAPALIAIFSSAGLPFSVMATTSGWNSAGKVSIKRIKSIKLPSSTLISEMIKS